jgi:hypothetical protein
MNLLACFKKINNKVRILLAMTWWTILALWIRLNSVETHKSTGVDLLLGARWCRTMKNSTLWDLCLRDQTKTRSNCQILHLLVNSNNISRSTKCHQKLIIWSSISSYTSRITSKWVPQIRRFLMSISSLHVGLEVSVKILTFTPTHRAWQFSVLEISSVINTLLLI